MKYLFIIIPILMAPVRIFAQFEGPGNPEFSSEELHAEADLLKFKENFIDAVTQRTVGNYDKASDLLSLCEDIYPDNFAVLYQTAENYFSLKKYQNARLYCDRALEKQPDNYYALDLSARIYRKLYDKENAVATRQKLYAIKDSEAEKLLELYYIFNMKNEGKALLKEVSDKGIYVENYDLYKRVFNPTTLFEEPQETETPDVKQPAAKLDDTLQSLRELYNAKRYRELSVQSADALAYFPAQPEIYFYAGKSLNMLKRYREALGYLKDGLDFMTGEENFKNEYYAALALAYQKTGNKKKSDYYKKMITH